MGELPVQHRRASRLGDLALRLCAPVAELHAAIYALRDVAGVAFPVRGSVGVGVVHVALPGALSPDRVADLLEAIRTMLIGRGGSAVVLRAPAPHRELLDLTGPVPGSALMNRVKEAFDPDGVLSPGRSATGR